MGFKTASSSTAPPVPMGLRANLSVMMFLQFAVWGAWFVVLGNYLTALGFSGTDIGSIYATMSLGAIISPMFIGQIADRYFSSERLMAVLHLGGAALLYWMAQITTAREFYWVTLLYALIYSPTLALSNSIAFTHLPDAARDFPGIRVLGTIGWIVANLIVGQLLVITTNQPLMLGAGFSLALGVACFFLPHTPPKGKAGDSLPFLRALGLLKEPSFAVFFGVSFVITIVLAFYYSFTGLFLEQKIGVKDVASTMTIGQWAEMLLLPALPFFLSRFGMKWVLAMGMLAWGIRYAIFAIGEPTQPYYGLVIASLALHGICFDFFFAAGFIHVDNEAPTDIRASAQALFSFLTYGAGMYLGSELSGRIKDHYTDAATKVTDWSAFWTLPSVGVLISLAIFVIFFHGRTQKASAAAQPQVEAV
jgi:nucleoside transporter